MSNKTSDKDVANIEDDVKLVKRYLENSAYKETDSDFFKNGGWEMVDLEIPKAMANILAEREQKDKRIQELEAKLLDMIQGTEIINKETPEYVKENYIPIQVVKDKIKEIKRLRDKCITTEGYNIANGEVVVLQELLEGERK